MRTAIDPRAVIALLWPLAACRIEDPFGCALDEHCGADGRCEPIGYCSFPDGACPEGRRYDELAGDGLGGSCTAGEGCPADYAATLPGVGSRYRVVGQPATWLDAQRDCADDGSGTHLAVVGSEAERAGLAGIAPDGLWIGFTDRMTEGTFRWVTGVDSPFTAWAGGKPDDADGTEDCAEQRRMMSSWDDQPCTDLLAYVCECDGEPPDPATL